jgi:hypothetical protein
MAQQQPEFPLITDDKLPVEVEWFPYRVLNQHIPNFEVMNNQYTYNGYIVKPSTKTIKKIITNCIMNYLIINKDEYKYISTKPDLINSFGTFILNNISDKYLLYGPNRALSKLLNNQQKAQNASIEKEYSEEEKFMTDEEKKEYLDDLKNQKVIIDKLTHTILSSNNDIPRTSNYALHMYNASNDPKHQQMAINIKQRREKHKALLDKIAELKREKEEIDSLLEKMGGIGIHGGKRRTNKRKTRKHSKKSRSHRKSSKKTMRKRSNKRRSTRRRN